MPCHNFFPPVILSVFQWKRAFPKSVNGLCLLSMCCLVFSSCIGPSTEMSSSSDTTIEKSLQIRKVISEWRPGQKIYRTNRRLWGMRYDEQGSLICATCERPERTGPADETEFSFFSIDRDMACRALSLEEAKSLCPDLVNYAIWNFRKENTRTEEDETDQAQHQPDRMRWSERIYPCSFSDGVPEPRKFGLCFGGFSKDKYENTVGVRVWDSANGASLFEKIRNTEYGAFCEPGYFHSFEQGTNGREKWNLSDFVADSRLQYFAVIHDSGLIEDDFYRLDLYSSPTSFADLDADRSYILFPDGLETWKVVLCELLGGTEGAMSMRLELEPLGFLNDHVLGIAMEYTVGKHFVLLYDFLQEGCIGFIKLPSSHIFGSEFSLNQEGTVFVAHAYDNTLAFFGLSGKVMWRLPRKYVLELSSKAKPRRFRPEQGRGGDGQ